jgi:hypothetical protein
MLNFQKWAEAAKKHMNTGKMTIAQLLTTKWLEGITKPKRPISMNGPKYHLIPEFTPVGRHAHRNEDGEPAVAVFRKAPARSKKQTTGQGDLYAIKLQRIVRDDYSRDYRANDDGTPKVGNKPGSIRRREARLALEASHE